MATAVFTPQVFDRFAKMHSNYTQKIKDSKDLLVVCQDNFDKQVRSIREFKIDIAHFVAKRKNIKQEGLKKYDSWKKTSLLVTGDWSAQAVPESRKAYDTCTECINEIEICFAQGTLLMEENSINIMNLERQIAEGEAMLKSFLHSIRLCLGEAAIILIQSASEPEEVVRMDIDP